MHMFVTVTLILLLPSWLIVGATSPSHQSNQKDVRVKRFQQRSTEQRMLSDKWIEAHSGPNSTLSEFEPRTSCPCENTEWCHMISETTRPVRESEVYGFSAAGSTGEFYNWTHISTVAWASEAIMCLAHRHGARAILAAPSFNLTQIDKMGNPETYISHWVQRALYMVRARHMDGLVFDFESPLDPNSSQGKCYVSLIQATRDAFHKNDPPLQVTTCVAWSPDGIDGRNYPHAELAEVSDLLYVMDYDTQSQITQGPCIAAANAPFFGMMQGINRFLNLGIDPKKLVLGVPWYGYRYPCLEETAANARYCPIRQVPFRGVNCSDAAGTEVAYKEIIQVYKNMTEEEVCATGGLRRDDYMDAAFFNILLSQDTNQTSVVQFWYDDEKAVADKFAWAKSMGLGGVGPYAYDDLDPVQVPKESEAMWSTFDAFRSTDGPQAPTTTATALTVEVST
jgi:di-N-acetylchitobiase